MVAPPSRAQIPSSWYVVHEAPALKKGQTVTERLLGTELTISRSRDGAVQVRDSSGRRRASCEVSEMVMVWEGAGEPTFGIEPIAELGDPSWSGMLWSRSRIFDAPITHIQKDVVDNDHFEQVHHLDLADTRIEYDGPVLKTISQGIMNLRRIGGPPLRCHIRLDGKLHGMGLLTYRTTITLGLQLHGVLVSAPTPVDATHTRMFMGVLAKRWVVPGVASLICRGVRDSVLVDYENDARYWESPARRYVSEAPSPSNAVNLVQFDRWLAGFMSPAHATAAGLAP